MLNIDGPSWFNLADYEYVHSLDAPGWYRALAIRCEFASLYDWCANRALAFDKQDFWNEFRDATSPDKLRDDTLVEWPYGPPEHLAAIEEIPAAVVASPARARAFAIWELDLDRKKLLCVDLDAPDTTLRAAFKRWLVEARKERPLPAKRRGARGRTPNIEITEDHFRKWRDYKVLACFDLNFWSRVSRGRKLSHTEACNWLKPDHSPDADPKDWGREAHKALKEALSCIDMLAHQASHPGVK